MSIKKELLVYGIRSYFTSYYRERIPKQPVSVYIRFWNSAMNKLGMPLPAGIMRLYKEDDDGSRQFIGEDRIEHTPRDEEVTLKVGDAFDVTAERSQTDFKEISTRKYESAWEITVRNHKKTDVSVGIVEPLPSTWEVLKRSHPFKPLDAFTIRFDVNVPKEQEVKVAYRIRVGL